MRSRTKGHVLLTASVAMLVMYCGCENSFSPKGEYQQHLVVYSVLSSRSDSQYVRVYTTYNLAGFDPAEHTTDTDVRGATVTMTNDSTTYNLKQTIIPRDDTSRYSSNLVAYFAYPCPLRPGKQYALAIISDQGNATASLSVPAEGYIYSNNPSVLKSPGSHPEDIVASIGVSSITQGYLYACILMSMCTSDKIWSICDWRFHRGKLPQGANRFNLLTRSCSGGLPNRRRMSSFPMMCTLPSTTTLSLSSEDSIQGARPSSSRRSSPTCTSDYNIVNGFQDPYSVREDQPDYTNIVGGLGVFGAMVEDSVVVDLR